MNLEQNLTRSDLARVLLLEREIWRRRCRQEYVAWATEALAPLSFTPALHHQVICNALQALVEGPPRGRLMIFAPPGSAKTTYVTRLFVPWVMQRFRHWAVIGASHRAMFAEENSQYILSYIRDFWNVLNVKLRTENVQRWRTEEGGDYLPAGVDAGISGFRADLAIIDDPVKSRKDAESETSRRSLWRWWHGDLARRLKPEAHVILMHTRWHQEDLAGMLLKTSGEQWKVLKLPAIANAADDPAGREIGEPLWTGDGYNYGEGLLEIRDELLRSGQALEWASLYQQDPRPADGTLFKVDKLAANIIDAIPAGPIKWARGYDLAATKDHGTLHAAYTAGVLMGRTPDDRVIIANVRRERLGPEGVEDLIVGTAQRDRSVGHVRIGLPQDPGQAGKFQVEYFVKKLAGHPVEWSPETGDKATRASPFASQVNVGNVYMLRNGDWNEAYLEELRSFPVGATLDQVDASSRAFSMIFQGGAALWAKLGRA